MKYLLNVLTSAVLLACVSAPAAADRRWDGVWVLKWESRQGCRWDPPPIRIRIANGVVTGISGSVSPSGELRWSVVNKDGNTSVSTAQLRGDSGRGNTIIVGTTCLPTFTLHRRR